MPQPTPSQVHVNRYLTNIATSYRQDATNFVATQVFPTVPVEHQSNLIMKFPKGYWMRDEMTVRGLGQRPAETGFEIESSTYSCKEWALEHRIDDRIVANQDQPFNADMRATQFLTEKSLIKLDRQWAEGNWKTGVWGTEWEGVTGGASEAGKTFDNFSESGTEPILFFGERADEMESETGKRPNIMVLGAKAYTGLRNNPEVVKRVLYISQHEPALVGRQALAAAFEVDKIVVAKAVYNSAHEGAADKVEYIADPKSALLAYAAPSPSIDTPSAGYTLAWTNLIPGIGNATAGVIYSGREEPAHTSWYQIRSSYDLVQTASDLGMFFTKVVK